MSVRVPCKHCGREISLRKMPNGQYVPFDKWTRTQHRCQDPHANAPSKSGGNISVGDLVLRVVSEFPGSKAKHIASAVLRKYGVNVDRSEVNRWLYNDLKGKVYQNGSHEWFAGGAPSGSTSQRAGSGGTKDNSYKLGQSQHQGAIPEVNTGMAGNLQSGAKQGSNKLLWAIIVLLIVVVLILLNK